MPLVYMRSYKRKKQNKFDKMEKFLCFSSNKVFSIVSSFVIPLLFFRGKLKESESLNYFIHSNIIIVCSGA